MSRSIQIVLLCIVFNMISWKMSAYQPCRVLQTAAAQPVLWVVVDSSWIVVVVVRPNRKRNSTLNPVSDPGVLIQWISCTGGRQRIDSGCRGFVNRYKAVRWCFHGASSTYTEGGHGEAFPSLCLIHRRDSLRRLKKIPRAWSTVRGHRFQCYNRGSRLLRTTLRNQCFT